MLQMLPLKQGVLAYSYSPSAWKSEQDICEFENSLDYKTRTY